MQDIDSVAADSVKNPKGITNDRSCADVRALRYARGSLGRMANAVNDIH
jgi:hypothetical protein